MTVRDGVVEGSTITFSLPGNMSLGSIPPRYALFLRSRRLGLSVTLDLAGVAAVDPEVVRHLSIWQAEGVTLSDAPSFIRQWARTEVDTDTSIQDVPGNSPPTEHGVTRCPVLGDVGNR